MNASGRDVMNDAAPCRPARTAVAPSCFGPFELHSDVRQGFVFCPRVCAPRNGARRGADFEVLVAWVSSNCDYATTAFFNG